MDEDSQRKAKVEGCLAGRMVRKEDALVEERRSKGDDAVRRREDEFPGKGELKKKRLCFCVLQWHSEEQITRRWKCTYHRKSKDIIVYVIRKKQHK